MKDVKQRWSLALPLEVLPTPSVTTLPLWAMRSQLCLILGEESTTLSEPTGRLFLFGDQGEGYGSGTLNHQPYSLEIWCIIHSHGIYNDLKS